MLNFFKKTQSQDPQEVKNKTSLKERLFKSKKKLGDGLSSLVIGKKKIDEDLLEELVGDIEDEEDSTELGEVPQSDTKGSLDHRTRPYGYQYMYSVLREGQK